ncbi:MAG: hypothetical protein OXQ31_07290 [Spirochaetaceae bacterium]|nr:hypothetical protein [Spirochaetaceae bacterium]
MNTRSDRLRLEDVIQWVRDGTPYLLANDDLDRAIRQAHALVEGLHAEKLRRDTAEAELERYQTGTANQAKRLPRTQRQAKPTDAQKRQFLRL